MLDLLCRHVDQEIYSAQLYLAMGAYCDVKAFKGFGRWLRAQHEEELDHARKVLDHVVARGGSPADGSGVTVVSGGATTAGVMAAGVMPAEVTAAGVASGGPPSAPAAVDGASGGAEAGA
jgi:hypothetical protein